jgi:hypothetical protein
VRKVQQLRRFDEAMNVPQLHGFKSLRRWLIAKVFYEFIWWRNDLHRISILDARSYQV